MAEMLSAESIFRAALERTPEERAAFLDVACAGNADLKAQIEQMLANHPSQGDSLDPARQTTVPGLEQTGPYEGPAEVPGTILAGKYKLLERIGEGGMGSVWMADQLEPVKRRVAVKLIRGERGNSRMILARFDAERQAIALMDHPHIAKLLDAGTTGEAEASTLGTGQPYFVMELVKGIPLNAFCDKHKLSIGDRLQLFMHVCAAVQHAHQKGIIHRDLKPSNILVESHDGKPVPRVIDFGLAKALSGQSLTENTLFTGFGAVAGTPLYMAPEQATFNALDIDTRADIYALCVILYEQLTGTTPIDRKQLRQGELDDILRVIREDEPPTPSKRLSSTEPKPNVAANRRMEPPKLCRFVRGDLDWITMKALAKERDRRYETANGFARDIERFLNHEPVLAGPPSAAYRLRKFVQRNRLQVIAGSLLLVVLLAGIAGTSIGLVKAEEKRKDAETAWGVEATQRERAEKARDRTWQALDTMTSSLTGDSLSTAKALSNEQKRFLAEVLTYYQEFAREQADDEPSRARTARAAFRVDMIEHRLGRMADSLTALQLARDAFAQLNAEFPSQPLYAQYLTGSHHNLGLLLRELGKWSQAEEQDRQAVAFGEKLVVAFPTNAEVRQGLARSYANLGVLLAEQGQGTAAEEFYRKALTIEKQLADELPNEPMYRQEVARSRGYLGLLFKERGKWRQAQEQLQEALDIQAKVVTQFPTIAEYREELAYRHFNLGGLLNDLGQAAQVEVQYHKALAIEEKLVAEYPSVAVYRKNLAGIYNELGTLCKAQGQGARAEESYRKALALQEALVAEFPAVPTYRHVRAGTHGNLGLSLEAQGKRTEAEEQHRKTLVLEQTLTAQFPTVPVYQEYLANSHNKLGSVLDAQGKRPEAEEHYLEALALQEKLVAAFPTVPNYRHNLATTLNNRANLLRVLGKWPQAEEQIRKALAIWTKLADEFPAVPLYRQSRALCHHNLAALLNELGKQPAAQEQYQKALALREQLVAEFPAAPAYRQYLAITHNNLGNLLRAQGQLPQAEEQFHKALALQEKLFADGPTVLEYRRDLAASHGNLGIVLMLLRKGPEAAEQYQKALALQEKLAAEFPAVAAVQVELGGTYCNFATLFLFARQPGNSLVWFEKAIRALSPVYEQDHHLYSAREFLRSSHENRAMACEQLRKFAEAVKDWDKVLELCAPQEQPRCRVRRALARLHAGQGAEALADVAEMAKNPAWPAAAWYDFACVYAVASGKITAQQTTYADRAMEFLQKAVKTGYNNAAHMKQDTDLDALRKRADFQKMIADLEKAAKASGKEPRP
jgi:serine/threonine protein kinase/tetratricopeptide (TPR) repeat protein